MASYRRTTLIMVACAAVLAGLVIARRVHFAPQAWWLAFTPVLLLVKRRNLTSLFLIIVVGLGVGLWRGGQFMHKLADINSYTGRQVTVQAVAKSDAAYSRFNSQLEFTAGGVNLIEPDTKPLAGMFKISGFGVPMVYRGDTVRVSGKIYPTRGSNQGRISYSRIETISPDNSWLNKFTREFAAGIRSALPEPLSSFGLGILIGQRNTMPEETNQQLITVGLVHIVAVSGYNLTIMVRGISLMKLRSKYQQLILSLTLIGLFVVITGFSASIVRAALISGLGLWAWYYGRQVRPLLLLLFTAAITSLARPFYIWGDLGWYLSFLAFFGILIVAPAISNRLFKRSPKLLSLVILDTLAAEIMTLPLIMMIFGQLSVVALLANAIIVPLVPVAMLLSAIAGMAGMFMAPIAGWIAWPAVLVMTFMLDIVKLLAGVPSAMVHATISPSLMAGFYAVVIATTLISYKKARTAIITDEKPKPTAPQLDGLPGAAEKRSESYGGIR